MSIKSEMNDINDKKFKINYNNTHNRSNYLNLLNPDLYIDRNENNLNMTPSNYITDSKLCGIDEYKYGEISGCSTEHKNIFKNPIPDYISRITDDSFISQFTPLENHNLINKKNNKKSNKKNNIENVVGLENESLYDLGRYKNSKVSINSLNELNMIDVPDYNDKYCHDNYQKIFDKI